MTEDPFYPWNKDGSVKGSENFWIAKGSPWHRFKAWWNEMPSNEKWATVLVGITWLWLVSAIVLLVMYGR